MGFKSKSYSILSCLIFTLCTPSNKEVLLFYDDYSGLKRGPLSTNLGAHTEYHYLSEAAPKGNWAVSKTGDGGVCRRMIEPGIYTKVKQIRKFTLIP